MATSEASTRRYHIAEVGRLTGFTATTLRYYEHAGVVSPPDRTAAGYRVYDDRDVERLRLVSRAKGLGCTLDEIAGLVQAWDADDCGPVKHRLLALVRSKAATLDEHIASQTAFATQLRATSAALADRPVDGPCDDTCGCATAPDTTDVVVVVAGARGGSAGCGCTTAGAEDVRSSGEQADVSPPPKACSLHGRDVDVRIDEWRALLADVVDRQPITNGVRLVLGTPAALAEAARLAAAEHDCCPFLSFALTVDARGMALEATAPPDGRALLDAVVGTVG